MALRWRRNPPERGLARVGAAPRGHRLYDDGVEVATVAPLGGGWKQPLKGWFWYCKGKNTCNEPVATVDEAKSAALVHYKAWRLRKMADDMEKRAKK